MNMGAWGLNRTGGMCRHIPMADEANVGHGWSADFFVSRLLFVFIDWHAECHTCVIYGTKIHIIPLATDSHFLIDTQESEYTVNDHVVY